MQQRRLARARRRHNQTALAIPAASSIHDPRGKTIRNCLELIRYSG